jgi:hypothetical protein
MECGGKTRKAQAEAEIAAAATTTLKGRNTGGERQEEEEIRSFDSLPLPPLFWLDLWCRRVPRKYEAQFKTLSGGLISSAKTRK